MITIKHHVTRVHQHLKIHHKKYLFGSIFGGLMIKLMLVMITGAGLWESSVRIAHAAPNFECATSTGVDTGTCEALVDLYTATDGDNWIHTEGWLVDTNVCNWYGVYCYVSGHNLTGVGTLRLRDNNLSGDIPASFGNITNLGLIYFQGNTIRSIPSTIGNLTNLGGIDLSTNKITSLPTEIGNLTGLTTLRIPSNKITELPSSIGNLTHLTELYVSANLLTGVPSSIGNLTGLLDLELDSNDITSLPAEIWNLTSLTRFWLQDNQLTGLSSSIGNLTNLVDLDLHYNQLTSLPITFANLTNLRNLYLENNNFTQFPAYLIAIIQKFDPTTLDTMFRIDGTLPGLNVDSLLVSSTELSGSLYINGNQFIGATNEWDGTFIAPQPATGDNVAEIGETGLNNIEPLLTIEVGSTGTDLVPYTGTFIISTKVTTGTSGQTFALYRSNYNDGDTWAINSPDTTCTLDSDNMCTFETNHLSSFTVGDITFDCDTATGVDTGTCEALAELYIATDGPNWIHTGGWLVSTNVCTWYGVGCYASGGVGTLSLQNNNLSGAIPLSFGNITDLGRIYMQGDHITSLPSTLGNLTKMSQIDLTYNKLTSIPSSIENLTGLWRLYLPGNKLISLPSSIGNLTNLRELYLDGNLLTSLPSSIGNLSSLEDLQITVNQLTGVPSSIGNLSNLQKLYLADNHITTLPTEIGNLSNLKALLLMQNELTTLPQSLGNLSHLEILYLENNNFTQFPAYLIDIIQQFDPTTLGDMFRIDTDLPGINVNSLLVTGTQLSGSLYVNGNQFIGTTNEWDGTFIAPTPASGDNVAEVGETGLNNIEPIMTIEVGSTGTDLIPYTGTFTISTKVATGTSGQTFALYRSNYNDGNTWALNSPDTTCTLDSDNMCTFETNHLSLFTMGDTSFDCATATGVSQSECEALVDLYASTNGDSWVNTGGWLVNTSVCSWYGVSCQPITGGVFTLQLQNNNLSGDILESFGNLTELGNLYMHGDHITSLPHSIGNLSHLIVIRMSSSRLSSLPTEIGNLTGLVYLMFEGNQLTGVPASIGNLTHLRELLLNTNHITSLPTEIWNLTGLVKLELDENQLTGVSSSVSSLTNLIHLYLSNNQLTSLPLSLIQLLRSRPTLNFSVLNNPGLQGIDNDAFNPLYLTGTTVSGGLTVFGNTAIGFTGDSWDGSFIGPQLATGNKIAVQGETGLGQVRPLLTIEAGSTTADLTPYTGTFTVSVKVASGASGQSLTIFRSNYNDGATWAINTPDVSCTLDSSKMCTFRTDHLSLFTMGASNFSVNIPDYSNTLNFTGVLSGDLSTTYELSGAGLSRIFTGTFTSSPLSLPLTYSTGDGLKTFVARFYTGAFSVTGTVTGYLDTTFPVITGTTLNNTIIVSGGIYSTGITLSFSDVNLSGAILSGINGSAYFSGNFHSNTIINSTGSYILTVTDLAGNTSSILFTIRNYVFCAVVSDVSQAECNALVDLYHATNGSGWTHTGGWLVNTGVCNRSGVDCSNKQILGLSLQSNNMSGSIPASISNLSNNLDSLYLQDNLITSLPASIGNLTQLTYLYLDDNLITSLPTSIGDLSKLNLLRLVGNQLTGVPSSIGNLSNLDTLILDNNQITSLPTSIGNLSNLNTLRLIGNQLTSLPTSIGNLSTLQNLSLSSNQLTSLPVSLIQLLQSHPTLVSNFAIHSNTGLDHIATPHLYTGASLSGSLLVSGNQYVGFSGASRGGSFMAPQLATGSKIAFASETGLQDNALWPILTIEVGATTADLIPYTGTFTISTKVAAGTVGKSLVISRSNYNDGDTWTDNVPDTSCTLDSNKMCTFRTDHLSLFTFRIPTFSVEVPTYSYSLNFTGILSGVFPAAYELSGADLSRVFTGILTSSPLSIPLTYSTGDGVKTFVARFYTGAVSVTSTVTGYLDNNKPTATFTPTTGASKNPVRVTLTGFSETLTGLNATGHLFTGNGSFTFTFSNLAGKTGQTIATVDRIDTTSPVITGTTLGGVTITSGGIYSMGITLSFSDVNLSGAVLSGINGNTYFSGDFQNNKIISTTGSYILTVHDLAGNTSSILFTIRNYVFCAVVSDVSQAECNALVDLYHSTNGSGWNRTGGRLVNTGVCNRSGVTCYQNIISVLDLHENNLSGGILPESIGNLSGLRTLDISKNNITTLPNTLPTSLGELDASYNQITSLPDNFGSLTNLQRLQISSNQITSLPSTFSDLRSLKFLFLNGNHLTALPNDFGDLSGLIVLDFNYNNLSSLPDSFVNLTKLSDLILIHNQLTSLPNNFDNLSGLSHLSLSENQLTSLPDSICNLPVLTHFYAANNQLTALPNNLGNLKKLMYFAVTNNQITTLPVSFNTMTGLLRFDLTLNKIPGLPADIFWIRYKNPGATLISGDLFTGFNFGNHIYTGASFSGSLTISGNVHIAYSGGTWDGSVIPPQMATGSKIALEGETGLNSTDPILTIEVGSPTTDIIPYTGIFTVSVKVASGTIGQTFTLYRSNYNDGNTWALNSPDTTCTLDSGNMCTFRTNHLSLFTMGASNFSVSIPDYSNTLNFTGVLSGDLSTTYELSGAGLSRIFTGTFTSSPLSLPLTYSTGDGLKTFIARFYTGAFSVTGTVTGYLDTTFPVITGTTLNNTIIVSGGIYSTGIALSFSDVNLSGAILSGINGSAYFSGNFQNNGVITTTGSYTLRVRDLAGNVSSILFTMRAHMFCDDVTDVSTGECNALVDLYHSTNGSGWNRTGGWLVNTNVCSWSGVTCSPAPIKIISFGLSNNNLSGAIPSSISQLSNLVSLNLQHNTIASLPASIGNMRNLDNLTLSYCNLYSLPQEIGNLTGLNELSLDHNHLTSLPSSIRNLTHLGILDLGYNNFTGVLPSTVILLMRYSSLYELRLNSSAFSGLFVNAVFTGTTLTGSLTVNGNQYIGFSGDSRDGSFLPPQLTTGDNAASLGETGLSSSSPLMTIEAGSTTADLFPATGYFTISVKVTSGTVGQRLALYRSNYNDGDTWTVNSPSTGCTLDSNKMCTFQTDHLSFYTMGEIPFDCSSVTDVSTGECNALVDLYNSTNGSGWTNKGGWLVNTGVSTRSGVSVVTGHVYQLLLDNNNLSGVLPSSLGNLSGGLKRLYLSDNALTGAIPTEIGNLTQLNYLYLYGNHLNGTVPSSIGNLTALWQLQIYSNELTGTLPGSLSNLVNLYAFDIHQNHFVGAIPSIVAPNMQLFGVYSNNFTSLPDSISTYNQLRTFNLESNNITSLPTALCNMTGVTRLNFQSNRLTSLPACIGNLTNLTGFRLGNNNFTGTLPASVIGLMRNHNLATLLLNGNSLSGILVQGVFTGTTLSGSLTVSGNQYIGFSGASWDGSFIGPRLATGNKIANKGEEGLTNLDPILTIEAGSTTADLFPATGYFTISAKVTTGFSGQAITIYRSNYNDGEKREINSPDRTCTLDSNKMCTFRTDHLSLFTLGDTSFDCDTVTDVSTGECQALVDLYVSTNGDSRTRTGGWLVNTGVCTWTGVSCTTGQVKTIILENNNLSGDIPESFGNLSLINYLNLAHNTINSLPESFGNLSNLEGIYLGYTPLDSLPESFGNLSGLSSLNLNYTSLTSLPDSFSNLSNLYEIYLSHGSLTSLPANFGNLSSLQNLYLNNNYLDSLPDSIGNLTNLHIFDLEHNQISSLPTSFGNLSGLQRLQIISNQITSLPAVLFDIRYKNSSFILRNGFSFIGVSFGNRIYTGSSLTGSLTMSGNIHVGYSGGTWDGSVIAPQIATGSKIAVQGETGLFNQLPLQTVEVGSTTADLIPYTGTFTVSVKVASGTVAQYLTVYRSNYNDGNTWAINSPTTGCTLDSNKMCTFQTNHLSLFTLTTPSTFCDNVTDVSASECNALVDFYHTTNGSGWTNTGGWLVNTGVCTWSGISSCSNGHVYGMLIQNNNLTGILPESFGNLVNLESLYLNGNHLTQLSNSFGNLTGLTAIRLDGNRLTSLPTNFGELNNLLFIYLDGNLLTTLPANFGNLSHLNYLSLGNNTQLTSLPNSFGSLTGLRTLYLNNTPLLTSLPASFGSLTGLTFLNLTDGGITELPTNFGNLSGLTQLYLNNNPSLTSLPTSFGNLTGLTTLSLSDTNISSLPANFSNLINLDTLGLMNTQIRSFPSQLFTLLRKVPPTTINIGNTSGLNIGQQLLSGTSLSGSLLISGNVHVGFSGASRDGSFIAPQIATGSKIAVQGETGLFLAPLQTIEVGSTTADLIPYTGTFTVSTYVSTATSGQQLNILRSNYNDGNTWTTNSPQTTCIVDSGQYCTFTTNHLSLFTFTAPDTTAPSVSLLTPGNGAHFSGSNLLTFTWTGVDSGAGISGYVFSLYSGANILTGVSLTGSTFAFPLANVANGNYMWQVIATDLVGNTGSSPSRRVNYTDTVRPIASVTPTTGARTGGNVYIRLTGYSEPLTAINATGHLFTGNGVFTFTYADLAGHTGSVAASVSWIDKTSPVVTGNLPASGSTLTSSRDIPFSWAGSDPEAGISGYTLRLSGTNIAVKSSYNDMGIGTSKTITSRPNGDYVRRIDAQDNVGNSSSTPVIPFTLHVPLTTTRSVTGTSFVFNTPTYYTTGYVSIFINSNQPASCTVTGNTSTYTTPITTTGIITSLLTGTDGAKALYFNCSTGADTSAFTINSLYLDTTGPVAPTLAYPTSGGNVSGAFVATWNIPSDAGVGVSGYMYYISNSPAFTSLLKSGTVSTTGVNIANFELGSTGTYYRYVVAKDRLGNVGAASPIQNFTYTGILNYTPTAFSFGSIIDATTKTTYTSSKVTIAGLSTGTYSLASIDKGVLYINDVMTGSTGYVKNGDTVSIEIISSRSYSTRIRSLLTIGDFSTSFSVTTEVDDGTSDTSTNLSSTEKLQVAIIFTTLKDLYDSTLRTNFLNTLLTMLNNKISDLEGETNTSSVQKKIDTLQYLYDLTKEYLGDDNIVDTSNRYTAPNGKVYSISYNSTNKTFTSPNFIFAKTFTTLDALKAYIDKNNGGVSGGGYSISGGGRDHVIDSSRQAAPYTAPGGKVYRLFKTTDNRYSSYDFKSAKYFSSVETLKAHIYAANKK